MLLKLFSLLALVISINSYSQEFDENRCFKDSFSINLERSVGPFGVGKRFLSIKKSDCEIALGYQPFQYKKTNWLIDVCREPIHIKKGDESVEVIKKGTACLSGEDDYCTEVEVVLDAIQNEGLIFAQGQREDLNSDHGKVYCAYLLAKKYLNGKKAFRVSEDMKGLLIKRTQKVTEKESNTYLPNVSNVPSSGSVSAGGDDLVDYSVKSEELSNF